MGAPVSYEKTLLRGLTSRPRIRPSWEPKKTREPEITGEGDFMGQVPSEDPENIFGFKTTFNGEPVETTLHQYVFAFGIDQTALLQDLGVPLIPFGEATTEALNALPDADKANLARRPLGGVVPA